ncbi:hypothetical protein BHF71_10850 [Vulcanibacillus modesticaldus]|uniref:DNA topology modulation protein FlaR n=1 Tax=Vulcanibacillus modesticaldus TaxID=337097 RepID=A0A1D2YT20_9BACI|nr:AAA family ATPase [Vulcanibacillus modesticaldus]OEF98817.1 hypothetical protein BHF71_10850 [Vulcanibacillus modesticaldus]
MVKIHIIGGPGSGKSYIGEELSKNLNINRYDLDDIFWDNKSKTYGNRNSSEKRNRDLEKILKEQSWIIEGVYFSWLNESFNKADYIFVLKPNVYLRDGVSIVLWTHLS